MVNHLHQKAQYFGEVKLGRDINFDDLTSEDIAVMLTGFLHVQADRDRTGRGILCAFSHLLSRWNDPSCPWTIGNIVSSLTVDVCLLALMLVICMMRDMSTHHRRLSDPCSLLPYVQHLAAYSRCTNKRVSGHPLRLSVNWREVQHAFVPRFGIHEKLPQFHTNPLLGSAPVSEEAVHLCLKKQEQREQFL